ncbi:MAG: hypothetical protein WC758_00145 [Candidatus Woesearchaeota archaeon]|jgi:hypothetical protein
MVKEKKHDSVKNEAIKHKITKMSKSKKLNDESKLSLSKWIKINNWLILVGVVIVALIILLIVFWSDIFPAQVELPNSYNGYLFEKSDQMGLWVVNIKTLRGEIPVEFYFHPSELVEFEFDKRMLAGFYVVKSNKGNVSIGYDVNLSTVGTAAIAGSEISKITGKVLNMGTKAGFVEYIGEPTIPVINCSIANKTNFVIEIRLGDKNVIDYKNYCAVIYAITPKDAVMLADFFDYNILKIIPSKN